MEQLSLPMGPQALVSLEEAWPWPQLVHAHGHGGDVPALARAWAAGRRDEGPYDLGDALVADGRVTDAALALVAALGDRLDAAGDEGRFARAWSVRLVAQARRRLGGEVWSAEALLSCLEPGDDALQRRVCEAVVPLLPSIRAHHRRDLAMPAAEGEAASRWMQALDLLTLDGWTGAATALDAGWPEDDLWEGLGCGGCGARLHAWTLCEPGELPCEVYLGTADGEAVVHGELAEAPGMRAASWARDPGAWVRWRLRGCDVPGLVERLAVRATWLPCPACGEVERLVHRAPGGADPKGPRPLLG